MKRKIIQTADAPAAIGPYQQAIQMGNLLFSSGQIALDPKTGEFLAGEIEQETERTLKSIEAILTAAGLTLENVVKEIQDYIYKLAVRMLWHPEDAKNATQEILIRMVTHLGSFENKSQFKTWVYRIASNSLINYKKKFFKTSYSNYFLG